jgi:FlaA1/EpsC-like NDP-sugar epimerase
MAGRWRRIAFLLVLDAALTTAAFFTAFLLRFGGDIPAHHLALFRATLPWLLAIRLPTNLALGLHRWSFRFSGLHEAGRLVLATFTGSALFVTVFYFFQKQTLDVTLGPPRSVIIIEFLLITAFMGALRFSPRFAMTWLIEQRIARDRERVPTIIVGAGSSGELLLRDLRRWTTIPLARGARSGAGPCSAGSTTCHGSWSAGVSTSSCLRSRVRPPS